ncbi:class I SAM-dependent methyltransferase [Kineosporia babensis]|uniref:Class I SAM-dependent methyltransferase n=1 Tax=Kineosporia babensis TaxID=499548 RepID=A0A9X1NGY4_9ACTN|nr:class I SAM-dependent methyltransferase [Kineosporia babensis]MCD5313958.1 class I SAM-dependent methyltransferase [Kineosporia babensis]
MATGLKQRGRADFNFLADVARWSGLELQAAAEKDFDGLVEGKDLPGEVHERIRTATKLLENGSAAYGWDRFYTRLVAERQFEAAQFAYDDGVEAITAEYDATAAEGGTVTLDSTVKVPAYWSETDFHLAPGGWEGHDRMGFMIHDYVYDLIFATGGVGAVRPNEKFTDARTQTAEAGLRDRYDSILELGIGTGRYAISLQNVYPDARITGVDLGRTELEHAKLVAARHGFAWDLRQAACEDLPFEDDSFDLVTAFILLHEVPQPAARQILAEAFRVCKPGGEVLIGDVAPYKNQSSLFRCVVLDWETENRAEPFWRGSLLADRPGLVAAAGFQDVTEFGTSYPWVTRGVKPLNEGVSA